MVLLASPLYTNGPRFYSKESAFHAFLWARKILEKTID
jgi:hypothetical protein